MIRLEDVGVRYDEKSRGAPLGSPRDRKAAEPPEILRDVNLDLGAGSFHFVIGASGAGKSTLLRLMYLAVRPTSGTVSLFGRDVAPLGRAERALIRRRIGVVFQDFRLLPHLTAVENVALPLKVAGRSEREVRGHVEELLTWVGLADHLDAYPRTLSGGQQQRVAIARAVINRPSVLLADEPTGNVDDRIALRLLYLFEELNKLGTTVVIATHNERLVSRFKHPILRIRNGKVSADPFARGGTFADGGRIPSGPSEEELRRLAAQRISAATARAVEGAVGGRRRGEAGGPAPTIAAPRDVTRGDAEKRDLDKSEETAA